jgi:two-component system, chemotaxis family, sensor kinase CheA
MSEFDESIMQAFIEDSQEQLSGITDDLLSIEAAGAGVDPELVNEVFRAIHSIKGGAGFLGLDRLTEMAHGMESVLNMVRNDGLVLNGDRTSVLLEGADVLVEMLADPGSSNERDIGVQLAALQRIADGEDGGDEVEAEDGGEPAVEETEVEPEEKTAPAVDVEPGPDANGKPGVTMNSGSVVVLKTGPERAAEALETLDYIYVIEYRKDADIVAQGKSVALVLAELEDTGLVLETKEEENSLFVLFATTIDPEVIPALVEVEEDQIRELVSDDLSGEESSGDVQVEASADGEAGYGENGKSGVVTGSGVVVVLETGPERAAEALETLDYIYLIEYRVDADIKGQGKSVAAVLAELEGTGIVLESKEEGGVLFALFATTIDPEVISALAEVEEKQIRELAPEELAPEAASGAVSEEVEEAVEEAAEVQSEGGDVAGKERVESNESDSSAEEEELPPEAQLVMDKSSGEEERLSGVVEDEPAFADDVAEMRDAEEGGGLPADGQAVVSEVPVKMAEEAKPVGPVAPAEPVKPALKLPEPIRKPAQVQAPVAESSLRVHVGLLDQLMNLAGELVLTRNQLIQEVDLQDLKAVEGSTQRLDQVTTELQETIVSTRMQPVGNVFGRFRRIVRDLSRNLGKEVELVIEGEEVELDKTIIEALSDPLTHLVRNALDHGIESPEARGDLGKPLPATLRLRALHQAGQVLIEVSDDGKGIDPQKVKEKVLSSGQYDRMQLEVMSEKDLVRLIFQPGFSTSEEVTDISGRGVGMDVVHTNLTRLGGVVDIDTEVGAGTKISIKLPLTLAIIPSLLVAMGEERFAIPQVNLAELARVPASQAEQRIQRIGEARVLRLRGRLLPLIGLREVLGIEIGEMAASRDRAIHIAVLKANDFQFGLIVDELLDSREIVVKSLDRYLSDCKIYAGATILGDGTVALILDVMGLSNRLELEEVAQLEEEEEDKAHSDAQELLLVHNAPQEQFALPVKLVSRIERIHRSQIERAGGRISMQYRGGHLVLFSIEQAAQVIPRPEAEYLYVIVFRVADGEVGLLASQIVDIVIEAVEIEEKGFSQPGISGSTIIGGKTTLMVDLYGLVRAVDPEWVMRQEEMLKGEAMILVAEDTPFFRQQFKRFLEGAGYQVLTAENGAEALQILEARYEEIDLLVTDIEMPTLDGLGLTRAVRADKRLAELPVIAVTSLSGEEDEKKGKEAGVDDYLIKIDQEEVLRSVHHFLEKGRGA